LGINLLFRSKCLIHLFADYKDYVIELLKKVITVSVETMKIVKEMESKEAKDVILIKKNNLTLNPSPYQGEGDIESFSFERRRVEMR
jgi:hypothetical protein